MGNGNANFKPGAVFCDIGDTLGIPVLSSSTHGLERLDVFPYVTEILEKLKASGIRLGIISNTGHEKAHAVNAILQKAGLLHFFETDLLIYSSSVGLTKDSPEIFRLAAKNAGFSATPELCAFVGENPGERNNATQAGFRVVGDLREINQILP